MKPVIIEYLEKLKDKFIKNNNKFQAYRKDGNKLILIGTASSKTDINTLVDNNLPKSGKVIIIYYTITMKGYLYGPLSLVCGIYNIDDKGELTKKDSKLVGIYYTEKELEERGLKKTDYNLVAKKLLKGTIESGMKKKLTISNLVDN